MLLNLFGIVCKPVVQAFALLNAVKLVLIVPVIRMVLAPSPVGTSSAYQSEEKPEKQEEDKCFEYQERDREEKHESENPCGGDFEN